MTSDSQGILRAASTFFADIFGRDRCQLEEKWCPDKDKTPRSWEVEELSPDWTRGGELSFWCNGGKQISGERRLTEGAVRSSLGAAGEEVHDSCQGFCGVCGALNGSEKSDKDQLNNYRPITLLNFTYKVLARADRMKKFLGRVISLEQYGFLPGRRLTDAMGLVVVDIIDTARNDNKDWFLLLVDFRRPLNWFHAATCFRQ
ncbi:unnamed protein product [Closterium sp. Yama58-4]|nr:unnamed protein product [Closterium sp. Yama58-4]